MKPLLETIDTRFGTASKHTFSRGNTLPYTGVPFGMNYFVPQTSDQEGSWFFDPHLPIFQGIRLTHQPSPWIGDYSWLLLTPVTGQLGGNSLFHRQSSYDMDKASFQPHYLKIFSLRYQIETQLSPTCYGASIRLEQKQGKALSLYLHAADELTVEQVDKRTLALRQEGETESNKSPLVMFTALAFSTDILSINQVEQDWRIDLTESETQIQLATSFISKEQAFFNLPKQDFTETRADAQKSWEDLLGRFDVVETGSVDRTFFDHCLYRLFLFPQTFYEVNEQGEEIHIDLASGTIKPGLLYTNNGFWDTFRTSFPLFALIIPEHYRQFLEGFLNSYRDTGYLPKWLAPDERGMMPGTLIDGLIADSACKNMAPEFEEEFLKPYFFRYSDYPDYTALLIKTLRQKAFHPSWEAYPGDEDNGSLSAWYVWSALGFYPTCPGKASYDLGIPLFDHLRIYLAREDKWLDIYAKQNHSHFNFVKECRLDKILVSTIQHQDLLKAEQLTFTLSWLPSH